MPQRGARARREALHGTPKVSAGRAGGSGRASPAPAGGGSPAPGAGAAEEDGAGLADVEELVRRAAGILEDLERVRREHRDDREAKAAELNAMPAMYSLKEALDQEREHRAEAERQVVLPVERVLRAELRARAAEERMAAAEARCQKTLEDCRADRRKAAEEVEGVQVWAQEEVGKIEAAADAKVREVEEQAEALIEATRREAELAIADLQATAHERARGEVADALATAEADAANAEAEVEDLRRELEAMAARKAAVEEERSSASDFNVREHHALYNRLDSLAGEMEVKIREARAEGRREAEAHASQKLALSESRANKLEQDLEALKGALLEVDRVGEQKLAAAHERAQALHGELVQSKNNEEQAARAAAEALAASLKQSTQDACKIAALQTQVKALEARLALPAAPRPAPASPVPAAAAAPERGAPAAGREAVVSEPVASEPGPVSPPREAEAPPGEKEEEEEREAEPPSPEDSSQTGESGLGPATPPQEAPRPVVPRLNLREAGIEVVDASPAASEAPSSSTHANAFGGRSTIASQEVPARPARARPSSAPPTPDRARTATEKGNPRLVLQAKNGNNSRAERISSAYAGLAKPRGSSPATNTPAAARRRPATKTPGSAAHPALRKTKKTSPATSVKSASPGSGEAKPKKSTSTLARSVYGSTLAKKAQQQGKPKVKPQPVFGLQRRAYARFA